MSFKEEKTAFEDVNPSLICRFSNVAEDGLGMPLPKGKISFYDYDKKRHDIAYRSFEEFDYVGAIINRQLAKKSSLS